jgi:tetratricopeptide (TPR) repeat protein
MRTFPAFLAALLLASVVPGSAQGLGVAYLEGVAEVRNGSTWNLIAVGDVVPSTAIVRLAVGSLVQLKESGLEITLTRPGSYAIKQVIAARMGYRTGSGSILTGVLRILAVNRDGRRSAVLGARAGDTGSDADPWADSTADVFLEAGREYAKAGTYEKALEQFDQASESATDRELPEIQFWRSYVLSQLGRTAEAWKAADRLKPSDTDGWAADFVLLRARLLVDSSAYSEAVDWLRGPGKGVSQDPALGPLHSFLLGLALTGEGRRDEARALFEKLAGSSGEDLGTAAETVLRSLRGNE